MSKVRAFLASQPKKKLVEMLYDLVMDCTEREIKALETDGTKNLTEAQKKAVVMSRLRRRLRRTLKPEKDGSR